MSRTIERPSGSIGERIELERQLAKFDYSQIRNNPDLNDEAKRRLLRESFEHHKRRHEEILDEARQQQVEERERASKALYAPPIPPGMKTAEREQLVRSARDAALRVLDVRDPEPLDKLADLARRLGDDQLEHAVFSRALDLDYRPIINSYIEKRPELQDAYRAYTANDDSPENLRERVFNLKPLQPPAEIL